jgi:hypothetical protein
VGEVGGRKGGDRGVEDGRVSGEIVRWREGGKEGDRERGGGKQQRVG